MQQLRNPHAPAVDFQSTGGEQSDRFGVGEFLFFEDASSQGLWRVVIKHGTGSLKNDRPGIVG